MMSPFLPFVTYIGCKGNHKLHSNVTTALVLCLVFDILAYFVLIHFLFVKAPFDLWSYARPGVQLQLCAFLFFVDMRWR